MFLPTFFRLRCDSTSGRLALRLTVCFFAIVLAHEALSQTRYSPAMPPKDRAALASALKAYDAQDDAAAEPVLRDVATRYPKNFEANEALGSLYAAAGDAQRALPFLEHACSAEPRQAVAHANLGVAYLKLGRGKEAVRELKLSASLDANNVATENGLGHALMSVADPAGAAAAFQAASNMDTNNADIRFNWALALSESNSPKQAEAVLSAVPAAAMTDEAHTLYAEIEESLGDFKQAIEQYQAAAQMNPSDTNLYNLTLELLHHWTWDEAFTVATFGAERYPSETRFQVAGGIALYGDSKFPEASTRFSQLLADDPKNEFYADLLGRSCETAAEAADTNCSGLEAFALAHPENARISVYAAASILHKVASSDDLDRAKLLLNRAIADDPQLAEAYYQLGVLDQQRGQWAESAVALEKAVALRVTYAEAHYRLSRAYAHMKRRDDAQHEIELQQRYSQQSKDQLNARMQEVVRFLIKPN